MRWAWLLRRNNETKNYMNLTKECTRCHKPCAITIYTPSAEWLCDACKAKLVEEGRRLYAIFEHATAKNTMAENAEALAKAGRKASNAEADDRRQIKMAMLFACVLLATAYLVQKLIRL